MIHLFNNKKIQQNYKKISAYNKNNKSINDLKLLSIINLSKMKLMKKNFDYKKILINII